MEDLCSEEHLGRDHWVFLGEEELCLEEPSVIRRVLRTSDLDMEVPEIRLVRARVDANNRVCAESLSFLV